MQVLLDKKATGEAIRDGLEWLAATGAETAYFFYSGHGTRVKDVDGDEARQHSGTPYDQAIVPVDYQKKGFIIDDELGQLYAGFPAKTKIIIHLDSCFSAKSDRGVFSILSDAYDKHVRGLTPRSLPREHITAASLAATYAHKAARKRQQKGVLPYRKVMLLAGCRDFETSADAYIERVGYRGAMTYYFEQAMEKVGNAATYRQVWQVAKQQLAQNGYSQIPQVTPDDWLDQVVYT
jgi:hypothetical protein